MTKHRYECPCGKLHPSFTIARACSSCVQYLETRMLSRNECPILKHTYKITSKMTGFSKYP